MQIELTTTIGCVNNCQFCPQGLFVKRYFDLFGSKAPRVLSYENFCRILKKTPKGSDIVFSGYSEPFQNPRCADMVLKAYQSGYRIFLYTTLIGVTCEFISQIRNEIAHNKGTPRLTITVHLPSEGNAEHINVNDTYLQTLNCMLASHIPLGFQYHGDTLHHKIIQRIQQSGYTLYHAPLHWRAGNIQGLGIYEVKRKVGHIHCFVQNSRNGRQVILPNGAVALCCMDFGLQHVLGNILSSSYTSIYEGKEWKKILRGLRDDRQNILCRNCLWASVNKNAIAELRNSPFSVKKIPLMMKYYSYNHSRPAYYFARSLYRKLRFIETTNDQEKQYFS